MSVFLALVLLGFKESAYALATDCCQRVSSSRPPPDPDSHRLLSKPPSFRWLFHISASSMLLQPVHALPDCVSTSFTMPYQHSVSWCLQYLLSTVMDYSRAGLQPIISALIHFGLAYWQFLFVWGGLVTIIVCISRLQRLFHTAIVCPRIHSGPVSFGFCYFLLWWLTQYNNLVDHLPQSVPHWFFHMQTVPVYCIIFRAVSNSLSFWIEWLLRSCLVQRRRSEPSMFVCGYTGAWYCAPRRRRRRGESPIRMPRLHVAHRIPSVAYGVHRCLSFTLQGFVLGLSTLMSKGSLWLVPIIKVCVTLWAPIKILSFVSLNAAYLTWVLATLLDLLVPPWYECIVVSSAFCLLRWLLRPSSSSVSSFVRLKFGPDGRFSRLVTRRCLSQPNPLSKLVSPPSDDFFATTTDIVPPVYKAPDLIPPPYPEHTFEEWMDPLMSYTNNFSSDNPTHDITSLLDDPEFWWSSEVDDISDDYMWGWFMFSQSHLSLTSAHYRFTVDIKFDDTVPIPPGPSWRARRTSRRRAAKAVAQAAEAQSSPSRPASSTPSLVPNTALGFLHNSTAPWLNQPQLGQLPLPMTRPTRIHYLNFDITKVCTPRSCMTVLLGYIFNVALPDEPLIVDTGASVCITPHLSDFIPGTYQPSSLVVKDLSGLNKVAGEGIIAWNVIDAHGNPYTIKVHGVHIESAKVRLLSPQVLMKSTKAKMSMTDSILSFQFASGHAILAPVSKRTNLPHLRLSDSPPITDSTFGFNTFSFESELTAEWDTAIAEYNAYLSVLRSENTNLRASQKELLLWHHRLSHFNTSTVRDLMLPRNRLLPDDPTHPALHQAPIIPVVHPATAKVDTSHVKCGPCLMAKARRRSPSSKTPCSDRAPGATLRRNDLKPGSRISCDHFVCTDRGRRLDTFGRNTSTKGYVGGALYVDHASGKVFHYPQTDLTAEQTIRGKQIVERAAEDAGFTVKGYHTDNGIFASAEFREHCSTLKQSLSFSGAHAHHQNGIAERSIGTISCCARANLIHLMLCWPDRANINLWAFAMNYAIWVYNRLPSSMLGGLSPNEVWSSNRSSHEELRRAHVFGCPVYVLDPKLADGDKVPKWNHRARMGMFLGFSHEHSSLVPLVLNLRTGHISPQYHVIFDDNFETVPSLNSSSTDIDDKFASLFDSAKDFYLDQIAEDDDVPLPSLSPEWDDVPAVPEGANAAPEGANAVPEGDQFDFDNPPTLDRTSRSTRNRSPAYGLAIVAAATLPLSQALHTWADLPAGVLNNPSRRSSFQPTGRIEYRELAEASILNSSWSDVASAFTAGYSGSLFNDCIDSKSENPNLQRIQSLIEPDLSLSDSDDHLPAYISPLVFAAKSASNSEDNPSYDEAMSGIYKHEYTEAAKIELHTLQNELDCWELVPRTPEMNVLPSTWAFKCKRFPDGRVKKFKARFCARGDRQKEGIDFFETWSPVVQWTTVRIMLIFSCILGLKSVQADITAAFVHAHLPTTEQVYVHQPRGFYAPNTTSNSHVLKLKRALYGLKQAPRHFFNYLSQHLTKHGLRQSSFDPCLFFGSNLVVIVYVDDLLIYSRSDTAIDDLITKLKEDNIWIRKEDSTAGFLGVDMKEGPDGSLTLTQTGLIDRIISALGLHSSYSTKKDTPAETAPLPKDANGEPADPTFNYPSIIGMLLYLSGHSRPDIAFAVHQCARYTFNPTKKHTNALKRIGRYLKGTRDKGIIMRPTTNLNVDCFPDADFAGLYNHEDAQDPHCVRSRTGFVILLAGCPVLWKSKLQTEIALSTMEAEYVALSQSCKDLFPLLDQINELGEAVGLPVSKDTNLHTTIYEDNVGALTLGRLEPKRMTPRSKHYAIKYHWFREQIGPRNIKLVKVDTKNQLGDIFTKGLGTIPFCYLRSKLMGW